MGVGKIILLCDYGKAINTCFGSFVSIVRLFSLHVILDLSKIQNV